MAASAFRADNLVAIVDRNGLQANGRTKERFDTGDIIAKFLSFGWHVIDLLLRGGRGEGNLLSKIKSYKSLMLRNPLFYRVICLFLVVYQKKYHFCLHVFQNISIFATLFSSVTYKVTALIIKLLIQ